MRAMWMVILLATVCAHAVQYVHTSDGKAIDKVRCSMPTCGFDLATGRLVTGLRKQPEHVQRGCGWLRVERQNVDADRLVTRRRVVLSGGRAIEAIETITQADFEAQLPKPRRMYLAACRNFGVDPRWLFEQQCEALASREGMSKADNARDAWRLFELRHGAGL